MFMKADLLKGLTEEQIAKIKGCKTAKEILEVAGKEGYEFTEERFEAVNGGCSSGPARKCPKCDSEDIKILEGMKHTTLLLKEHR